MSINIKQLHLCFLRVRNLKSIINMNNYSKTFSRNPRPRVKTARLNKLFRSKYQLTHNHLCVVNFKKKNFG